MPVATSCFAKKLGTFVQFTEPELKCIADLQLVPIHFASGQDIMSQGEKIQAAYILLEGWGRSFKMLEDGGRQIITFPLPGDLIGLRSMLLRTSDHAFSALTDVTILPVEMPRILRILNEFPRIGTAVLWAISRDEAVTIEHLGNIGRRSALHRTAHFFLELFDRLKLVGLATETEFACPLTQYDLADALGLSAIHVNRVLRELRQNKLMTFRDHKVTLHDRPALKKLTGYEDVEGDVVLVRSN